MEIKFQNFFTLLTRLKRFVTQRMLVIAAYSTNSTALIQRLNDQISEYRMENLEFQIVHYIDFEFIGSSSLIDAFIDLARIHENDNQSPIASTTSKMVYDFYLTILNTLNEGHAFLKLSYDINEQLMRSEYHT
jgi:hypothetical protein